MNKPPDPTSGKLKCPVFKKRDILLDLVPKKNSGKLKCPVFKKRAAPLDQGPNPGLQEETSTRKDASIRTWESQYFCLRSVKMKLNSFTKKNRFISAIQENVTELNHIIFLAYHLINFHFIRLLELDLTIPKTIDQTFVQRACYAISLSKGKLTQPVGSDDWIESVKLFRTGLNEAAKGDYKFPERQLKSFLITNASQAITIAINNHLNLNFNRRLAKYLKITEEEKDGAKAHYWADRILNLRFINPEYPSKFESDETEELIKRYRNDLEIKGKQNVNIKTRLDRYLPFYYKMLKCFEDAESKKFTIMPMKGEFGECFIKIDSSAFGELLTQVSGKKGIRSKVMKDRHTWWKEFFHLNKVETDHFRFSYELKTNGYEVSILIRQQIKDFPEDYDPKWSEDKRYDYVQKANEEARIAREKERENGDKAPKKKKEPINPFIEIEWQEYLKILGLDPGRRSLYTVRDPDTGRVIRCTAAEWKFLTGQKKNQNWRNNRKDRSELIQSLHQISFKTSKHKTYLGQLKSLVPNLISFFTFFAQPCYKKRLFTQYTKRQKAFHTIIDRLVLETSPERKTIIGFGNGSVNNNGACRGAKVPCKSLYNEMCRHPRLVTGLVDEQYSTMRCHECHHDTVKVYKWIEYTDKDGNICKKKSQIYGLRRCSNNECRITWDRDYNASYNIQEVTVSSVKKESRPAYLTKNGRITNSKKKQTMMNPQLKTGIETS